MVRSAQPWHRTFLIIFTGQAFSLLGSSAVNFALVWWLTAETGSASVLAYASIAALVPQAVVGLLAGPFIDRWDRRRTMMGADLFVAVTSVVLLAMVVSGDYSVLSVIAVLAARSLGAAFHTPASQAAVPMYVPQDAAHARVRLELLPGVRRGHGRAGTRRLPHGSGTDDRRPRSGYRGGAGGSGVPAPGADPASGAVA